MTRDSGGDSPTGTGSSLSLGPGTGPGPIRARRAAGRGGGRALLQARTGRPESLRHCSVRVTDSDSEAAQGSAAAESQSP